MMCESATRKAHIPKRHMLTNVQKTPPMDRPDWDLHLGRGDLAQEVT
jgi:hypothetical protein